jgi:hypothetical protein
VAFRTTSSRPESHGSLNATRQRRRNDAVSGVACSYRDRGITVGQRAEVWKPGWRIVDRAVPAIADRDLPPREIQSAHAADYRSAQSGLTRRPGVNTVPARHPAAALAEDEPPPGVERQYKMRRRESDGAMPETSAPPSMSSGTQCVTENPASADRLPCVSGGFKVNPNFVVTREISK